MKHLKILSLFFAFIVLFSACEKVSPPFKESNGGGNDTTGVVKNVLLEDYTGHTCVHCPTAAVIAHNLKHLYGDRLIVMAVHAGYFADPHPGSLFDNDYRTPAGNEWNIFFGFQNYPSGLIDRVPNAPGDYIVVKDKWGTKVAEEMQKEAEADITLSTDFSGGVVSIGITTEFLKVMSGTYSLFVGITEDSIVSAQKNENPEVGETPIINDYVFMHMFRGAVNGTWGENIFGDAVEIGKQYSQSYQYTITGNPDNSHVVAYVYDNDTKTVIQVVEKGVK